jgi:thioredoxin-dependent peroxiredoxin
MTLTLGQPAPTFSAVSDNGEHVTLEGLRGFWTVLYFYPKASTPGCSIEAQRFEASLPEFSRLNARVIGVSTDTEAAQAKMREKCSLSFPLLPDSKKEISRAYGVMGGITGLFGVADRQTFLIDPQGKLAFHWKKVNPMNPAREVLDMLEEQTGMKF